MSGGLALCFLLVERGALMDRSHAIAALLTLVMLLALVWSIVRPEGRR